MLENTHTRAGGTVLSVELTERLTAAAKRHDTRVHLDGARLVNAAVAQGASLASLAAPANSVALSLNKGLSAPFGAVLAGSDAVVERARLMLHRLGGASVHRAGIAAAAGLVALRTMVDRIADDHRRARALADGIASVEGIVLPTPVETNIVVLEAPSTELLADELVARLAEGGVRGLPRGTGGVRLVTHRLISDADVVEAVERIAAVVGAAR